MWYLWLDSGSDDLDEACLQSSETDSDSNEDDVRPKSVVNRVVWCDIILCFHSVLNFVKIIMLVM